MIIDRTKEQIERDMKVLQILIDKDPLYPIEDVDVLLERLKTNIHVVQDHHDHTTESPIGMWVQVHEKSNKPYYGKVEGIPEVGFFTLEGLYATQEGKLVQRAIRQDMCLAVSRDVARALEFANGMNSMKVQDHLYERN